MVLELPVGHTTAPHKKKCIPLLHSGLVALGHEVGRYAKAIEPALPTPADRPKDSRAAHRNHGGSTDVVIQRDGLGQTYSLGAVVHKNTSSDHAHAPWMKKYLQQANATQAISGFVRPVADGLAPTMLHGPSLPQLARAR